MMFLIVYLVCRRHDTALTCFECRILAYSQNLMSFSRIERHPTLWYLCLHSLLPCRQFLS